jgi:hypothetical protein
MKASILGKPRPEETGKVPPPLPPEAKPPVMQEAKGEPAAVVEATVELRPDDKLIGEILADLQGEAGKAIEALLRARDEAAAGLQRLEESLVRFRDQKGVLQGKLHFYITESTKALERGEKPKDAEIRKVKIELEETEYWVDQLEKVAIPQAVENAKATRKALAQGFVEATKTVHEKFEKKMADCILSALDLYQGWKSAYQAYQKELDMWRVDFPPEGIPNSILKFPLTTSKPSEEFLSLSLGNKRHI